MPSPSRMRRASWAPIVLLATVTACDLDAAVFVAPTIESGAVEVTASGLVTGVSGDLSLQLHLGSRASGAAEVTLGTISLTNEDRTQTLVETVGANPSMSFPVTVNVDSDVVVDFTVAAEDNLLEADAADTLCSAGPLTYVVVIDDSLRGASATAVSDPITPTGCP